MSTAQPDVAWLAALAGLSGVGPARLTRLMARWPAEQAWQAIVAGHPEVAAVAQQVGLADRWRSEALRTDVSAIWSRYREAGVGALARASPAYPSILVDDPEPPEALFTLGDPSSLAVERVGIVGTRRCTRYGIDVAYELGHLLASNGVGVVSGLALGIDAAAHAGALDAAGEPPVAIVGSGLDAPYPRQNRSLWQRLAEVGVIFSEAPLGAIPERWRFPARNRIIAALSQVVVVVESHEKGGSLYTAAQAEDRGRPVFAVPGPIRSSASAGCNRLLADGCHPLCALDDILVAVGMLSSTTRTEEAVDLDAAQAAILDAVGWQPTTIDQVAARVDAPFDQLALAVEQLRALGALAARGPWLERTALPARPGGSNGPPPPVEASSRPRASP